MKKLVLFLSLALALTGCTDIRTEHSDMLREKVTVVALLYSPSEHKVEVKRTAYNSNGTVLGDDDDSFIQTGVDYDGNEGIKIGKNHQITSTTIPEKYGVVFQCLHGTFTIEGSDQKYRILHNKLANSLRDTVEVLYKEEYRVTYEKDEKTGKKVETSRVLNRFDFIDAQIIKK